jgi:integrase
VYQTPKSDASRRTISIDSYTAEALRKWRIAQAEERLAIGAHWPDSKGHVVTEPDGRLPDPNTFTRRFKAICKKLVLPVIRLHDLRHSYVVASRKAGVPLKTISARVGHADINVTSRIYDHILRDDDEDAAEQTMAFIRQRRAT